MPRPPRMSSPRRNDRGRGSHGSRLRHARMSRRAFSSNFGKASLLPLPSPLSFEPLHPRRALRCPILQRSRRRGREVECPGGLSLPRTSVLDILAVVLIAVIITVAASRAGQSQAPGKSTGLKWDTGTASGSQCSSTVEGSSRAFQCNIESLRQSGAREVEGEPPFKPAALLAGLATSGSDATPCPGVTTSAFRRPTVSLSHLAAVDSPKSCSRSRARSRRSCYG
jgi:hypothetical protein